MIKAIRQLIYILTYAFTLASCNHDDSATNTLMVDTLATRIKANTLQTDNENIQNEKLSYNNVSEVVKGKKSNAWVELNDSSASLALHFNLFNKDTLSVSYSSECWIMYPINTDNNKIIVYWDNFIDSKYDFEIVNAIKKIDKKHIGEPFMVLELINDTTLKASYPIPELIEKINNSSTQRTFFPDKFIISQEYYF